MSASDDSLVALSKALTKLLRHHAMQDGVPISPDGWMLVEDALRYVAKKRKIKSNEAAVRKLVEQSDKQRFSVRETNEGLAIRANQGHSMDGINIAMQSLPDHVGLAVHGTYHEAWPSIQSSGLSRMARQHVHMARDLPGQSGVVSGMRSNCELLIWVDVARARAAGMRFFESENGVILTDGIDGAVPTEFFDRVEERATGKLLLQAAESVHSNG